MKLGLVNLLFLMAMGLVATACTEDAPPPMKPDYGKPSLQPAPKTTAAPGANKNPAAGAVQANPQYSIPVPPEGARYTLYCQSITGPGHVDRAALMKNQLLEATKMSGWYLLHNESESIIYYGYYRSFNDPKDARESARAQADRKTITSLQDSIGDRPFKLCIFVGLDSPDPSAPAEWNLANARGVYTLQIAAYTGSDERKKIAVDAVREAREKYGVEAYYYHGDHVSSVCVGTWPADAINVQGAVVKNKNVDAALLVAPPEIPEYMTRNIRDKDNKAINVVREKMEVIDPGLKDMMAKYPQHTVNGELDFKTIEDPRTKAKMRIPVPAMIVPIPKPTPSILNNGGELAADPFGSGASTSAQIGSPTPAQQQQQQPLRTRPAPVQPGAGKLKSVGQ